MSTVRAGLAYFAIVFTIGFAFGILRTLLVEPSIGAAWAVAVEVPIMLAVCWFVAGWLVRKFRVKAIASRLQTGLLSLLLLVAAETLLGLAFGQTLSEQVHAYRSARGLWTLLGQLGFAAMPLVVRAQPDTPG